MAAEKFLARKLSRMTGIPLHVVRHHSGIDAIALSISDVDRIISRETLAQVGHFFLETGVDGEEFFGDEANTVEATPRKDRWGFVEAAARADLASS